MRPADRTLLTGLVSVLALTGAGVVAGVSQEKKPAPADPFATAFPDIPAKDPDKYPCPRFMGRQSIPADRHDMVKRLAKAELDALVQVVRLAHQTIESGRLREPNLFSVLDVYRRIPVVAAEVIGETDELVPWLEERVAMGKWLEQFLRNRFFRGPLPTTDLQVRAERLHAEQELLRLKAKLGKR
jgi:hypothetical protein